jgi:hypothetical protein
MPDVTRAEFGLLLDESEPNLAPPLALCVEGDDGRS